MEKEEGRAGLRRKSIAVRGHRLANKYSRGAYTGGPQGRRGLIMEGLFSSSRRPQSQPACHCRSWVTKVFTAPRRPRTERRAKAK